MINTLKIQRAIQNLPQDELGKLIGVSNQTISSIEKNKYVPSTILALKLSRKLKVTIDQLFSLEETD